MVNPLPLLSLLTATAAAVYLSTRASGERAQGGQGSGQNSILEGLGMADVLAPLTSDKRGIRNNNPLNIEHGDPWRGMAAEQPDGRFITFTDPRYGYRAAAIIIGGAYRRRGQTTLAQIIGQWAPPKKDGETENDTQAYIDDVSRRSGIAPFQVVSKDRYVDLFEAMTWHENGEQPYERALIAEGVSWA